MVSTLKVKKVVVFDFQEPYSQGLAAQVATYLTTHGVTMIRLSAPNTTTDYSSYVTKVPSDTDVVFFPTQQPPASTDVRRAARRAGQEGGRVRWGRLERSGAVQQAGWLRLRTSPGHHRHRGRRVDRRGLEEGQPRQTLGSFGPPTYGAVQVMLNAIKLACAKGHGTLASRADVFHNIKKVAIKNWILGGTFKWSTKTNDPLNAKFYIFKIQSDGSYKLVS